jgi:hypothetical protein
LGFNASFSSISAMTLVKQLVNFITCRRESSAPFFVISSVPHSLANGFKKLLAVAVGTDYTFKEAEKVS